MAKGKIYKLIFVTPQCSKLDSYQPLKIQYDQMNTLKLGKGIKAELKRES